VGLNTAKYREDFEVFPMRVSEIFDVMIQESAPPGKKAATWIKHRKADFQERYGKHWQRVLYAKAWKLFGESTY
jgi:hypothetical protein